MTRRRLTPDALTAKAARGEKLVCLTAYTAPTTLAADPHCDLLLVGDSLAMVLYGHDTTRAATLELMIAHGAAVARIATQACVIVDMPFGSYEDRDDDALANARRIMAETGAEGVKLEGGHAMQSRIAALVAAQIPVLAHIGLTPQSVEGPDGFKSKGRSEEERAQILADARAVEEAGAFAVVVEAVAEPLARDIAAAIAIPTIGIGASAACAGQILVAEDMLGLLPGRKPKFVRTYADLHAEAGRAVAAYAADVRSGAFPADEQTYRLKAAS